MLNDLKIRSKLIIILFAPLVALLVFASVGVRERNDTASRADQDVRIIGVVDASAKLIAALSDEGAFSVAASSKTKPQAGQDVRIFDPAFSAKREAAVKATEAATTTFEEAIEAIGESNLSEASSRNLQSVRTSLRSIESTRVGFEEVDQLRNSWMTVMTTYSTAVESVSKLSRSMNAETTTPEVVLPLQELSGLVEYLQADNQVSDYLVGIARQGSWALPEDAGALQGSEDDDSGSGPTIDLTRLKSEMTTNGAKLQEYFTKRDAIVTGLASSRYAGFIRRLSSGSNLSLVETALKADAGVAGQDGGWSGTFEGAEATIDYGTDDERAAALLNDVDTRTAKLTEQIANETTDLTATVTDRKNDSARAATLFVLFAGLVIVVAVLLAIWVALSITRRINKLTVAAERLSHEQLPRLVDSLKNPAEDDVGYLTSSFTEIEVSGADEIGNLADAFNRIQGVAVEVATEQAQLLRKGIGDMFVNLARRNQSLLDRQIEFIDQLEAAEEDPDQLENLFRLDHLATRMRRNAESLLVLAGAEPNRRRGKPVPLADVVRAAVGEVEDFARIDMLQFDEVLVASNAALDIAHLLSELMENAANFSPPDSRVEVVGHRTKAEGYVISVADHGIGMSPEQLTESNDLLARPPLVGLALSRSLGFIVIGRLAARFGIAVRLMPSPSGGTTAMVSLPPSLITDQPRSTGPGVLEAERTEAVPATSDAPADGDAAPTSKRVPKAPTGAAPAGGAPPMARRAPGQSAPPKADGAPRTRRPAAAPNADAPAGAPTAGTEAPAAAATEATSSGLTKRVPRAAGAKRAVPGGENARTASKNRRSPEEVRSMLSRYQSGVQRGRSDDVASDKTEEAPS